MTSLNPSPIVLIADDNRDAADNLAMLLEIAGFEPRVAYNGLQAVDQARSCRPAAVILDINMPGLDGYGAARAIRTMRYGMRTVLLALTARTTVEDIRAAEVAGFDVHLAKPAAGDQLVDALRRALDEVGAVAKD